MQLVRRAVDLGRRGVDREVVSRGDRLELGRRLDDDLPDVQTLVGGLALGVGAGEEQAALLDVLGAKVRELGYPD